MNFESMQKQPRSPLEKPKTTLPPEFKESISPQELDALFQNLELNPINYIQANVIDLTKLIGKKNLNKPDQRKIGELLDNSWRVMSAARADKNTDKRYLNKLQEYLITAQNWFEKTYGNEDDLNTQEKRRMPWKTA